MQSWSWKIGRIAGIPIYIHWTFLILIGWLLLGGLSAGQSLPATLVRVGFVLALFGCVVLHELGHALTARRFGVQTSDITLLPIGGVARLQRIPERPSEELLVAIAGPLVNVAIVVVLLLLGVPFPWSARGIQALNAGEILPQLMLVNILLVAFNLLPAFPMDGGRIFRAFLAMFLDYGRATRIAAGVGQLMAIVFAFWGLGLIQLGIPGNPFLLFIALFVWIGAGAEAAQVQERLELQGIPVREAMLTDFHVLAPGDTLAHATELLLAGTQHDFPVMDGEQVVGVLTRESLMRGLAQGGRDAPVAEYASADVGEVEANSMLIPAVALLREGGVPCLQVVAGGRTVGLLTLENIGEYLMVRAALHERREAIAAT